MRVSARSIRVHRIPSSLRDTLTLQKGEFPRTDLRTITHSCMPYRMTRHRELCCFRSQKMENKKLESNYTLITSFSLVAQRSSTFLVSDWETLSSSSRERFCSS